MLNDILYCVLGLNNQQRVAMEIRWYNSKHFKTYKKIRANLMGREDLLKIEWSGECIKQKQKYINGNQYHG